MQAAKNFAKHTGAEMPEIFKMASKNPADATGFTDRGEIKTGKRADLIVIDGEYELKQVVFEGKLIEA